MIPAELSEILDKGLDILNMTIDGDVAKYIVILAQGLPHYVHLLGLYSSQAAIRSNSSNIDANPLSKAIAQACDNIQQSVLSSYSTAISSSRTEAIYPKVLLACTLAGKEEMGCFKVVDVREPLSRISGKEYSTTSAFNRHLSQFCEESRGGILEKKGIRRNYRFRFKNAMIPPYIIMEGIRSGMIKLDQFDQ